MNYILCLAVVLIQPHSTPGQQDENPTRSPALFAPKATNGLCSKHHKISGNEIQQVKHFSDPVLLRSPLKHKDLLFSRLVRPGRGLIIFIISLLKSTPTHSPTPRAHLSGPLWNSEKPFPSTGPKRSSTKCSRSSFWSAHWVPVCLQGYRHVQIFQHSHVSEYS